MTSGRLRAVQPQKTETKHGYKYWLCLCACGKSITTKGANIRSRSSLSCGCLKGKRENSVSLYSRAIAQNFWQQHIKYTGEFTDSISADELQINVCEYAAIEGHSVEQMPTWDDLFQTMPIKTILLHRELYAGQSVGAGDIFGIKMNTPPPGA